MRTLVLIVALMLVVSAGSKLSGQPTGLEIGNKAPEIRLPTTRGDTISLSSQKGKMVLIDFWGTWCAPCVEEQADLARLYKKFKKANPVKGRGFEIYGVSLDAKKPNWENFIIKNKISWIQVSDLKFWRSPVAKTYKIEGLPFNVLVDSQGIILAKNLHGTLLEEEIVKHFSK